MDITIKRVPEKVYQVMKIEARRQGRSLNAEIIRALEGEAEEVERRNGLRALRKELDRFAASLPAMEDSTPTIRRERKR